ncbi:hypothetical protein CHARACLAT_000371 [Characodon lateralis]|uniref:Uncharacterized protein n=1 Tax=Characodon lateralis TaxID=208331 RepID=A0ABU7DCU5_9TELE|nr:hypothetical protein [Characodon lateralis]
MCQNTHFYRVLQRPLSTAERAKSSLLASELDHVGGRRWPGLINHIFFVDSLHFSQISIQSIICGSADQASPIPEGPTSQHAGLKGSAANILVQDITVQLLLSSGAIPPQVRCTNTLLGRWS